MSDKSSAPVRVVVMEGDGIGPEITAATLGVLRAAARAFALDLSFSTRSRWASRRCARTAARCRTPRSRRPGPPTA